MRRPDKIAAALMIVAWIATLVWILVAQPESLGPFMLLNAYVLTLLYALTMRASGDPDATAAILLAVFLPPLAAALFFLRWADSRRGPEQA